MKQLGTLPHGLEYTIYEMRASWNVDFIFYRRLEKKFFLYTVRQNLSVRENRKIWFGSAGVVLL